jgi:beta-lactamase superfamily II metal-dependent hydrolase
VDFIDVGQGDSILIATPIGKTILIDGGDSAHGQTVIEYLRSRGVTTIDALVVSHGDADHIGGLASVLNTFTVRAVFDTGYATGTQTYNNLISAIHVQGTPLITARRGSALYIDPSIQTSILSPSSIGSTTNDNSIVVLLSHSSVDFLFPGDASQVIEQQLIGAGLGAVEILKVGHHGSSTSTSSAFLDTLDPAAAVISVGQGNPYGHPTSPHSTASQSQGQRSTAPIGTGLSWFLPMGTPSTLIRNARVRRLSSSTIPTWSTLSE